MKLSIQRETLLRPLQVVSSVVERRQTLPVLSNVLLNCRNNTLTLTGTDLEVEMIAKASLDHDAWTHVLPEDIKLRELSALALAC